MISIKPSGQFPCNTGGWSWRPGGEVAYYRLYLMSNPDGRFIGFEEIEANDDVEAIHMAERHLGPQPLELWCGKRRVKTIPAKK